MFDDEMMLQETSEAEEIENEDTLDDEDEVWDFEDDEEEDEADETDEDEEAEEETEETEDSETDSGNEDKPEQNAQEETNPEALFPGEFEIDGVTRQVTMNEAAGLVKKGLLYGQQREKYLGKLKDAYADPRIAFVDELAAAAGQNASEYIANVRMQKEYNNLLETYGSLEDVPPSVMKMFTDNAQAKDSRLKLLLKRRNRNNGKKAKLRNWKTLWKNIRKYRKFQRKLLNWWQKVKPLRVLMLLQSSVKL